MLSASSAAPLSWSDDMLRADSVLVVDDIARAATRIGQLVTLSRIDGAIHDVLLSAPEPRVRAYAVLDDWMAAQARGRAVTTGS